MQGLESVREFEAAVAHSKERLAEMVVKRDEAKAALEEIERKRRDGARALLLGKITDAKAIRAAANARDDAQKLLEDMELVVEEAQIAVVEAEAALADQNFYTQWTEIVAHGARRVELLAEALTARDRMYEAIEKFRAIGQGLAPMIGRLRHIPVGVGVDPQNVRRFVGADIQRAVAIVTEVMPQEVFMNLPEFARPAAWEDMAEKEISFWDSQALDIEEPVARATA